METEVSDGSGHCFSKLIMEIDDRYDSLFFEKDKFSNKSDCC